MAIYRELGRPPQYLMWGVFAGVVALSVFLAIYYLLSNHLQNDQRLATLQESIEGQINQRLAIEVEDAASYIEQQYAQAEHILRKESRDQVKQAIAVAQAIYTENVNTRPELEVKRLIVEALRNVRFFGGRGYIFIGDNTGKSLLLPPSPQFEGSSMYDFKDDQGKYFVRDFLEIIHSNSGSGFSEYRWYPPDDKTRMRDKITYIERFEPYNWLVGAGDYVYQIQQDQQSRILDYIKTIRFGDNGYISVLDREGVVLAGTGIKKFTGLHLSQINDTYVVEMFRSVLNQSESAHFHRADWFQIDGTPQSQQLLYVKPLPLWGWVLVAGSYSDGSLQFLQQERAVLDQKRHQDTVQLVFMLALVIGLAIYATHRYSRWMKRRFQSFQSDIDQKNQSIEAKDKSLEISARIVDAAHEGIMLLDRNNKIIQINNSFIRITGYEFADVQGHDPRILGMDQENEEVYPKIIHDLKQAGQWHGELWGQNKAGETYPLALSITSYTNTEGNVENYIATFSNISERKAIEEKLEHLAQYDSLTDLSNRRMLSVRLQHEMAIARREGDYHIAVLYLDLDYFKAINDTFGHSVGDQVLICIARRLTETVREVDLVSRIGGDEFVILASYHGEHIHSSIAALSRRIIESVAKPIPLAGETFELTTSIGIAVYPVDGDDENTLLKHADIAMYQAKQQLKNNYQFYDQCMTEEVNSRFAMEKELKRAIQQEELQLYYQPQYDMQTQRLSGFEALLRWPDKMGHLLLPAQFLSVAEESGLIIPLGEWVIRSACKHAQEWFQLEGKHLSVSVNLSARQLTPKLVEVVEQALEESGVKPQSLVLEIKENTLIRMGYNQQGQSTIEVLLQQLHELGVRISIDDFATKYSSLGYLARLPIDQIKIDRGFVCDLPGESQGTAIAASILKLAQELNIRTVAEGVETAEQIEYLAGSGCDQSQGFFYSQAIPLEKVKALINHQNTQSGISDVARV